MKKANGIRYQDSQLYSECQLISVLNAAYFLGEKTVNKEEYDRLIDMVGARYGSAISIERSYKYLRVEFIDIKPDIDMMRNAIGQGYPIGFGVWTQKHGLHSVTAIEVEHDNSRGYYKFRVPNLKPYTDKNMWIHQNDLKELIKVGTKENIGPTTGYFRAFFIDPLHVHRKGKESK